MYMHTYMTVYAYVYVHVCVCMGKMYPSIVIQVRQLDDGELHEASASQGRARSKQAPQAQRAPRESPSRAPRASQGRAPRALQGRGIITIAITINYYQYY